MHIECVAKQFTLIQSKINVGSLCFTVMSSSCPDMFKLVQITNFPNKLHSVGNAGIRLICIAVCKAPSEKFLIVTNGYGKIMQLIYWHIIGWLEYGNCLFVCFFSLTLFILLRQQSLYAEPTWIDTVFVQRAKGMTRFAFSVNTRLFACANRLSVLYMVIKIHKTIVRNWSQPAKGHILFGFGFGLFLTFNLGICTDVLVWTLAYCQIRQSKQLK